LARLVNASTRVAQARGKRADSLKKMGIAGLVFNEV